jgi:hypothetical protein
VLRKLEWLEAKRPWRWKRLLRTSAYLVCAEHKLVPWHWSPSGALPFYGLCDLSEA